MHTTRRSILATALAFATLPVLSCGRGSADDERCAASVESVDLNVVKQRWNDRSPGAEQLGEFTPAGEGEAEGFALSTADDGLAGLAVSATTVVVENIRCGVELRLTVPNATDVTQIPDEDALLARFVYAVSGADEQPVDVGQCYGGWLFGREATTVGAPTTFHAAGCNA